MWNGKVTVGISENRAGEFALKLRIPGWAQNSPVPGDLYSYADGKSGGYSVTVNGQAVEPQALDKGYLTISRRWKKGDVVELTFDMSPRYVVANEKVAADRGRVAVERGPIVYCAEWPDNRFDLGSLIVNTRNPLTAAGTEILNGVTTISTRAQTVERDGDGNVKVFDIDLTLIPYYAWANRGEGKMAVWLPSEIATLGTR